MVVKGVHVRKRLLLAFFLFFLTVNGESSGPDFIVTFPAVIEVGSNANLCISFLNPNETLQLEIFLVHENQNETLLKETVEKEFHRCSQFKAPLVNDESVQEIKVRVKGENFEMSQTRKVMFKSYNPLTFIQTDKPIYNPGQTVNMRVVTMNSDLIPIEEEYSSVIIEDTNRNIIAQWLNVSSQHLLLELSHKLNPEAPLGLYWITSNVGERRTTHKFMVKKYVLPKFEITVTVPQQISVEEEELYLQVCGKYTYGQPVAGRAEVVVCRKLLYNYNQDNLVSPCMSETLELKRDGCGSLNVNVSTFMKSEIKNSLSDTIEISAKVIEEGTDISLNKSAKTAITYQIGKVHFIDLPKNFERGKVIEGKIIVTSFRGTPIPNKKVYLLNDELRTTEVLLNLTTDSNGLASFKIDAPDEPQKHIQLGASIYPERIQRYRNPHFSHGHGSVYLLEPANSYSPVYSELLIEGSGETFACGIQTQINIKYFIIGETNGKYSIDVVYMVLSKGAIVHHGYETVDVNESADIRKGAISFTLSVSVEFSPAVQILAYSVLPSKNVIAASKTFDVEKCFKNKISLQFSASMSVPGEENSLELSAQPGSLCALGAVDQSVYILESEDRLTPYKIFNLMPRKARTFVPYMVEDEMDCLQVRPRRDTTFDRVYETLKGVGLKMATNLAVRTPRCLVFKGITYHHGIYDMESLDHGMAVPLLRMAMERVEPIQTVRKFFPETWIWQLVKVGESGTVQVPVTVPDTITTWETETFCVSSIGLGLAPSVTLTVFQPFFLELSLPYSIIRGEIFELKATVFNYIPKCIMVKVTPAFSPHYTLEALSDGQYSSCLCANGRKTFKWTLIPSVLGTLNVTVSAEAEQSQTVCDNEIVSVPERGHIDTVTRSLLVQAEGTEKSKSQTWLLCPQGNS